MFEQGNMDAILDKVEKLLRLAAANPNEAEAAAATAKAQDLLVAYNLDMSAVEERSSGGQRLQEQFEGGRFEWQRELWDAVATLNFCIYVNRTVFIQSNLGTERNSIRADDGTSRLVRGMYQQRHIVVGRKVNVMATRAMATYLESTCDRIVKDRLKQTGERANGRWANSFRVGLTDRVINKIYDRRSELLNEERRKKFEEKRANSEAEAGSTSTATALTITSHTAQETDANIDFLYGEGTSAIWAANRAKQAAAEREAEEEYTRWAAANPEKARKLEEQKNRKKERERERENRRYFKNKDSGAWLEGFAKGDDVSLDQQAGTHKAAGYLK